MIPLNTKGEVTVLVDETKTALAVGSGDLRVFATPMMAALMEAAAAQSIKPFLAEGESSVGTKLEISHIAATPVGQTVRAESEVTESTPRRVTFIVRCFDESGLIGEGTHVRAVIDAERFMKKCSER